MRHAASAIILIQTALAAVALAQVKNAGNAPVTLEKGVEITSVLRSIEKIPGWIVVSDIPAEKSRLQEKLDNVPIDDALPVVSQSFDLFCIKREKSLVMQRRYSNVLEYAPLEIEEITASSPDIARLVHQFTPKPLDATYTKDKADFLQSLTSDQLEAARGNGLAFTALNKEQQRAWRSINNMFAFASSDIDTALPKDMFDHWQDAVLVAEPFTEGKTLWSVKFKDISRPRGYEQVSLPINGEANPASISPQPGAFRLAADTRPSPASAFNRKLTFPAGVRSLPDLVRQLEKVTDARIKIPGYARGRKLLVAGSQVKAWDVIVALEELYNWQLAPEKRGSYTLQRAANGSCPNVWELFARLYRVLPPTLVHLTTRADDAFQSKWINRRTAELKALVDKEVKTAWTEVRIKDLSPDLQQRVALNFAFHQFTSNPQELLGQPTPPYFIATPERGFFKLGGSTKPGGGTLVTFSVPRPDGQVERWGWAVGSGSRKR